MDIALKGGERETKKNEIKKNVNIILHHLYIM